MRLREMLVLGALTFGAMACGDSLAPPASEGRDLEFALPAVQGPMPGATRYRTWDEPVSDAEIAKLPKEQRPNSTLDAAGGEGGEGDELRPLILSKYAIGEFVEDQYRYQFGMFGFGSGYSMTPSVRIVGPAGNAIDQQQRAGRSEDAPVVWYMRPHVEDGFQVGTSCGAMAELSVLFEVRLAVKGVNYVREQATERTNTYQRTCPLPVTSSPLDGAGSLPVTTYDGVYICYYEVWVDGWGRIVDVYFIRCDQISGPILMV